MIKALIFDFFGVIGQSTYAYIADKYSPSQQQRVKLTDLHKSLDHEYISYEQFINQYADILSVSVKEISEIFANAKQNFHTSRQLLDYIEKHRNLYKIALLSNVSGESYKTFIQPIVQHFDVVVTSYSVKMAKPDVEIFSYIARQLQLDPSECVMIDDNEVNCEGAIAAGMQAIKYVDYKSFINDLTKYCT